MSLVLQNKLKESIEKYSSKPYLKQESEIITYGQIGMKSDKIEKWLSDYTEMSKIGLMIDKTYDFISAMIGILYARDIFVPFMTSLPEKRMQIMNDAAKIDILITDKKNFERARRIFEDFSNLKIVTIDEIYESNCVANVEHIYKEDDPVYIYFTSGTTGIPKAILGKNKSVTHFIQWETKEFSVDESVVTSQITSVGFDASLRDFFLALFNGGVVSCPKDKETLFENNSLKKYISENKVSIVHCTPSVFRLLLSDIEKEDYNDLKYIMLAGEPIRIEDAKKWYNEFDGRIKIVNFYGASETTMIKAFHIVSKDDFSMSRIPVGKPIDGAKLLVLNARMKPCPIGCEGEVYIRTPYCSLGYYNDDRLTKEKFIVNPYTKNANDLLYRTGDIGMVLPNGEIDILGRTDRMVKIHGSRIELNEIESVASQIDGIEKVAVICKKDNETNSIILFYVADEKNTIEPELVRKKLEDLLPSYAIPHFIQKICSIPLNSNGKIEYKELEKLEIEITSKKEKPATETEKRIMEIWRKYLNLDEIGVTDDFFSIGGHSLNVMMIVGNINKEFEIDIPLKFVFTNPTIRKIAEYIDNAESDNVEIITKSSKKEYYRLTSGQKRLFALQQLEPENPFYIISKRFVIEGVIDQQKIIQTLKKLILRHHVLAAEFVEVDNEIVQRYNKNVEVPVLWIKAENEIEAYEILDSQKQYFDLFKSPLFRICIVKLNENRFVLEFQIHHIISDGISMNLLVREFCMIYECIELPEMKLQYFDYAEWEGSKAFQNKIASQENFWLEEYKDEVPVLNLPVDYLNNKIGCHQGRSLSFKINDSLLEKIEKLQNETGVSKYSIFLSAYSILLSRYSGQEEIVIGMPVSGRSNNSFKNMIGLFVNTVPIKFVLKKDKTYQDYLKYIWNKMIDVMDNQDYPFDKLVEKLGLKRSEGHNLMFDAMFSTNEVNIDELSIGNLKVWECNEALNSSKFMLTFSLLTRKEKHEMLIEYDTSFFREDSIIRMWECYVHILEQICNEPLKKLSKIDIIPDSERNKIIHEFNNTYRKFDYSRAPIALFEEQVEKHPDKQAVWCKGRSMTYLELNQQSNKLARLLEKSGIQKGDRVGIIAERSVWMMVASFGVLKLGATFVPIDSTYPQARIQYIIKDCDMKLLLIQDSLSGFDYVEIPSMLYGEKTYIDEAIENKNTIISEDSLMYQIYTSGSTGNPKGVMVSVHNILNTIFGWREEYRLDMIELNLLQLASFSFDVFIGDWCKALLNGGTMFICPEEDRLDVDSLKEMIQKYKINYFETTPGVLFNLMDYIYETNADISSVKMITVGSDTCNYEEFRKLYERYGEQIEFRNSYGLTESTVDGSFYKAGTSMYEGESVPIGKPMANYRFYVMDAYENILPVGVFGELYISGDSVTQGYCGKEDLTAQKYVVSVLKEETGRMYKTGDLARWLPDGNIEFAGRIDNLVKVNGFRIETGEIENCLLKNECINECAVLCLKGVSSNFLVAFVTLCKDIEVQEIKEYLAEYVPNYMMPRVVKILDIMPMTHNGKIDVKKLQQLQIEPIDNIKYEEPVGIKEQIMAGIWNQVTGKEHIGRNDDFMEIGGDSIKLLKVLSLLRKNGYSISAKDFYQNTILKNASFLMEKTETSIHKEYEGELRLMPVQNEFFMNPSENKHHWNQAIMIKLKDKTSPMTIECIIAEIVKKHSMLRTTFKNDNVNWCAFVHGPNEKFWKFTKKTIDDNSNQTLIKEANLIQRSLNYCIGPTMHIALLESNDAQFVFVCIHHLVVDNVSWRILLDDLNELFGQIKNGKELEICPEINIYSERVAEIYNYLEDSQLLSSLEYWKKINDAKCDRIPGQKDDIIREGKDRRKVRILLNEENTQNFMLKNEYSIQDKLLAILCKTLNIWGGLRNVCISMENNGRYLLKDNLDLSRTVGWFTAEYPLVFDDLDEDINTVCSYVHKITNEVPDNGISYGIIRNLKPEMLNVKGAPAICFNYHGEFEKEIQSDYFEVLNLEAGNMVDEHFQTPYSLSVQSIIFDKKMQIDCMFDQKEFSVEQMESFKQEMNNQLKMYIYER